MNMIEHPLFPKLRSYMRCMRRVSHGRVGIAIEFETMPHGLLVEAREMKIACAYCGKLINPVRVRRPPSKRGIGMAGVYFSAVCPGEDNASCCRSGAAREAVEILAEELEGLP